MTDKKLLKGLRNRENWAIKYVYKYFTPVSKQYNSADLEDITQNAVLSFVSAIERGLYKPQKASLRTYYNAIFKNKKIDYFERNKGHSTINLDELPPDKSSAKNIFSEFDDYQIASLWSFLLFLLEEIPLKIEDKTNSISLEHRQILEMTLVKKSYQEIARVVDRKPDYVKNKLRLKAFKALAQVIYEEIPQPQLVDIQLHIYPFTVETLYSIIKRYFAYRQK